jgi:hypothetical protein
MHTSPRSSGGILRRGLAVCVVLGQLLGTVGIVPLRADTKGVSTILYPCQDHPCGCRTAEQCWAGPCCCFTMREKVAWAAEHGIVPPQTAVQMAKEESNQAANDVVHTLDSDEKCCAKSKKTHAVDDKNSDCCSSKQSADAHKVETEKRQSWLAANGNRNGSSGPSHGIGWVASLFAKKCQGPGFNELGFLNIGVPPSQNKPWACEFILLGNHDIPDQIAHFSPTRPLVPPPKS